MVLEKTLESPLDWKEIQPVHPKGDQSWIFIRRTDNWSWNSNAFATWCKELTHWKRLWCWERLKVGGEGDDRGWDVWMASLSQWTWLWASSERWRPTGKACMLPVVGWQSQTRLSDGLNWLWNTLWPFFIKLHIRLTYNPAITLEHLFQRNKNSYQNLYRNAYSSRICDS